MSVIFEVFLLSSDDMQITVSIEISDIACFEEAVIIESILGCFGIFIVSLLMETQVEIKYWIIFLIRTFCFDYLNTYKLLTKNGKEDFAQISP